MSTSKHFDRICAVVIVLGVLFTLLFMNGTAFGLQATKSAMGYENRLFDTSRVHSIDLVVDDWDSFLENCEDEEYVVCSAVIDGESYKNIALRAKGNTSLSSVRSMDSSRFSFKLEFDHFNKNESYHGLDKLCLNNIIQDNTYMKDYLTYRLMGAFGVDAPLCSYVYITVNGEDWGLYLAVEGIEDSFLQRNYGNDTGELYKPDSMSMGGGKGNGREFDMDAVLQDLFGEDVDVSELSEEEIREKLDEVKPQDSGEFSGMPGGGFPGGGFGNGGFGGSFPGGGEMPAAPEGGFPSQEGNSDAAAPEGANGFTPPDMATAEESDSAASDGGESSGRRESGKGGGPGGFGGGPGGGGPGGFGMGSDDVKLRYIDDDPASYSGIFDSAKTLVTEEDKKRMISSLQKLSEQTDLEEVLDIDEVLRYFVVHNFVVNGDSYTGSMIHNFYLHEKDGRLSMIPWDYNLAYGCFQASDASGAVNDPIDTPLSIGSGDSRPMADWIFADEEYTAQYHALMAEFLESFDLDGMIRETAEMIAPYVEKDPTKFCTYEEFEKGVETLRQFCALRSESVRGQLDGTIPSTDEGQSADPDALVDTSGLTLSALGSMGGGGGGAPGGGPGGSGSSSEGGFPGGNGGGLGGFPGGGFGGGEMPAAPEGGFPSQGGDFTAPEGTEAFTPPDTDTAEGSDSSAADGTESSGRPDPGNGGGFPGGGDFGGGPGGGFPGGASDGTAAAAPLSQSDWIMIAACFAVLLVGILFVKKFRCST